MSLNKPEILRQREIAKTRIFKIEELSLKFSNGEQRVYERMVSGGNGAVMTVALNYNNELLLIKEYSAGTHDYQLAFPKGLMEAEESPFEAANRELKEEVGFGAKRFEYVKEMTLAPGYFSHKMHLVLARDLYEEKLKGDEPEPLELILWPIDQIDELVEREDFTEARSIAAVFMIRNLLKV